MRFSILTPTRNRPSNCIRFIQSVYNTSHNKDNVEMLFYVDNDDPSIEDYKKIEGKFTYGDPISVSKSWNIIAEKCKGDYMIMGNDDLIYRTPGWDTILTEKLSALDPFWCSWVDDGINGKNHCAFPIISREWYDAVGYFAPGIFNFGYNDTWVFEIAKRIDRCNYIKDIFVEHMHFTKSKSEMDDTYARNRTQEKGNLYKKDLEIFNQTVSKRIDDSQKIINEIRNL